MSDEIPPLRYVILRHEGIPEPHFDLMFETSPGSPLRSWRAQSWPLEPGDLLTELPRHRSDYLEFEGEISGDRGCVIRVHAGACAVVESGESSFAVSCGEGFAILLERESERRWRVCEAASGRTGA